MAHVFVSVGSNIERDTHIRAAAHALQEAFGELTLSTVYESRPVGFDGDNFYNMVVAFDSDEEAASIIDTFHAIEDRFGRERDSARFTPRTLDLDLLLYDDVILNNSRFELPRDEISTHAFVLRPLAEIAPLQRHPVTHRTFAEMWQAFDMADQELWEVAFDFRLK